jgi:hypothetical protein
VSDWKDSLTDWEKLGWALREVFPDADYRSDKKIAKAWNDCFAALHLVLDRHVPGYDSDRFDNAIGGRSIFSPASGSSKKDRRILSLSAVIVSIFLFWQYHDYTMGKARIAGRGDVWAKMCEDHPKLAEQLMNEPEGEFPRIYHCKDFEHHLEENP